MKLFQVIVVSMKDHHSLFVAAGSRIKAKEIANKNLNKDEIIHFIREVKEAVSDNKKFKIDFQQIK